MSVFTEFSMMKDLHRAGGGTGVLGDGRVGSFMEAGATEPKQPTPELGSHGTGEHGCPSPPRR